MEQVFICKIKIIGSCFAVLDEQLAKAWVELDPKIHYYEPLPIKTE